MRYKFNIQQFAEGGDAGAAGADAGNADAGGADEAAEQIAEHAKQWNDMINGEFREDYQSAIKSHLDKRFSRQAELEEKVGRLSKLHAFLSDRYGTEDEQGILDGLMNDDSLFEREAAERGLTTDQYKEYKKLEFERNQSQAELEEIERQKAAQDTYAEWIRQSDEVKKVFPEFDLEAEISNDNFASLLQNGVDMMTAYKVCHMDDVVTSMMATTAQNVAERVTDSIRSKGLRPLENGIGSASQPATVKVDIDKLSIDDMKELNRKAARGERISLR